MKKTFLIYIILSVMVLSSCQKIFDVSPEASIDAEDAVTTKAGVAKARIGCFDALQFSGYYGLDFVLYGDLSSDNLRWAGTSPEYNQINNNTILADNLRIEGTWRDIYEAINRTNILIAAIPGIADMTASEKNQTLAECHFLRGLHYYNLVRLWGGVPIKLTPTTGKPEDFQAARKPVGDVYSQIISDLSFASANLPSTAVPGFPSKWAARGLLAQVYLNSYNVLETSSDLDSASHYADLVLEFGSFSLATDFNSLYSAQTNNESLFEITYNTQDNNRIAYYYFSKTLAGRYEFAPSDSAPAAFEPGDLRKPATIKYDVDNKPFGYKYRDIAGGTDRVYVLRLASLYLTRAEILCRKQAAIDVVKADINKVRNRAGLADISASTYADYLQIIEKERRVELMYESARWFDLCRTKRALEVLPNLSSINQTLFPIPQYEIQTNTDPGMFQNPGY
jgi:hypothetical protein